MKQIPVWRNKQIAAYTFVDDEDYDSLNQFNWRLTKKGYVYRNPYLETMAEARAEGRSVRRSRGFFIHRVVMGLGTFTEDPVEVDHIDRDKLNNQKSNLRLAPDKLNYHNVSKRNGSSKYKNVSWVSRDQKWQVQMSVGGRKIALGHYDDEEEAGRVASQWRLANRPFSTD